MKIIALQKRDCSQAWRYTAEKPQGNPRLGVINRDDVKSFDFLNDFIKVKKLNYGLGEDADVRAVDIQYSPSGIHFTAQSRDFSVRSFKQIGWRI